MLFIQDLQNTNPLRMAESKDNSGQLELVFRIYGALCQQEWYIWRDTLHDIEKVKDKYLRREFVVLWLQELFGNYAHDMLSATHDILSEFSSISFPTLLGKYLHKKGGVRPSLFTIFKTSCAMHPRQCQTSDNSSKGIRRCNYLSTGVILLADILQALFIKTIGPFPHNFTSTITNCGDLWRV